MNKIITYLTAAAIVFDIFTPFQLYFAGGRALMFLIPTVLIILKDRLFLRQTFIPLIVYLVVCFIVMIAGSEFFNYPYLIQVAFVYACLEHFLLTKDFYYSRIVLVSVYATLLVMVAVSLPLFISMPNLSRLMLDAEENGITDPILYWSMQYSTLHALPIYSIPLFYLSRNRKGIIKYISIISIIAIFILMFYADTTTGVIVNIAVFASLMIYKERLSLQKNIARLFSLGVLLLVLLNKSILISILLLLQPIFEGSSTHVKIDEMITSLSGQTSEGDLAARERLLQTSWNSLLSNPLLPEFDYSKIGHHNFIIDQIVVLGLLPSIPFFVFIVERIKRPLSILSSKAKPYYLMGVIVFLIMGFLKNFFLLLPACAILPILFITEELNKK